MRKKKVLLTNPIHPAGVQILQEVAEVMRAPDTSAATMSKVIVDVDALIVRATSISPDILKSANKLQVIVRHGVGLDTIPVQQATEKGILVANTPWANTEAVAEHVVGMFLMLARQFHRLNLSLRQAEWSRRNQIMGLELHDKTLGVIGVGKIGYRVASICQSAFGMVILGYDPYVEPFPQEIKKVTIETLFQESDFVTVHVPLTDQTHHLIKANLLSRLKSTAFFVNTSRGHVVDEVALVKTLADKRIAGAGLDVYHTEPLPEDHPLLSLENVILTPHSAALTTGSFERMGMESAHEVVRVLKGEKPLNLVNPEIWNTFQAKLFR